MARASRAQPAQTLALQRSQRRPRCFSRHRSSRPAGAGGAVCCADHVDAACWFAVERLGLIAHAASPSQSTPLPVFHHSACCARAKRKTCCVLTSALSASTAPIIDSFSFITPFCRTSAQRNTAHPSDLAATLLLVSLFCHCRRPSVLGRSLLSVPSPCPTCDRQPFPGLQTPFHLHRPPRSALPSNICPLWKFTETTDSSLPYRLCLYTSTSIHKKSQAHFPTDTRTLAYCHYFGPKCEETLLLPFPSLPKRIPRCLALRIHGQEAMMSGE